MRPLIGATISHYKITDLLGKGGMGEVYRARDEKLGRDVALKVLPPEFVADGERVARFEREARTLASLNHSNIASIHGFEEDSGHRFLVMELVEGEDLSARLTRGAIPLDEAIPIAQQIVEGLDEAHAKGVVHRDLKPGNIKVGPDGQVKILDFGLARAFADEDPSSDPELSPTITAAMTTAGVILGTAAYMSPEQARGRTVDKRTDIWSFGVVMFEMLTGTRLFSRSEFENETVSDTIGAILNHEPDWSLLPPETPRPIRRLLRRCLERDRRRRLRDIGDATVELNEAFSAEVALAPVTATRSSRNLIPWVVAALFAIVAMGLAWKLRSSPSPEDRARSAISAIGIPWETPMDLCEDNPFTSNSFAVSPRGDQIAYIANDDDDPTIFLRSLDRLDATPLLRSNSAAHLTYSPDGQWLAYSKWGSIYKVAVSGGAPVLVADVSFAPGMTWADDDALIMPNGFGGGLIRIPAADGDPQPISTLDQDADEVSHRWPHALPGGRHVLYTIKDARMESFDEAKIAVLSVDSGESKVLIQGGSYATYVDSGHILYGRGGRLYAVTFDLDRLEVTGTPRPVLDDLLTSPPNGVAHYAVAGNDMLLFLRGGVFAADLRVVVTSRDGSEAVLPIEAENPTDLAVSPDGRKLAVKIAKANDKIWIYDFERQTFSPLTSTPGNDHNPVWSPDSRQLVYSNDRNVPESIYRIPVDGSGPAQVIFESGDLYLSSWSPDGKKLLVTDSSADTNDDLHILSIEDGSLSPFLDTPDSESDGVFSPNGEWVAYTTWTTDRPDVFVRPYPGPGGRVEVSINGGRDAKWTSDGRNILFLKGRVPMVAPVTYEPEFRVGKPEVWGPTSRDATEGRDFTPDGEAFIVTRGDSRRGYRYHIDVIFDWVNTLREADSGS